LANAGKVYIKFQLRYVTSIALLPTRFKYRNFLEAFVIINFTRLNPGLNDFEAVQIIIKCYEFLCCGLLNYDIV
jgi:hypothetical protein